MYIITNMVQVIEMVKIILFVASKNTKFIFHGVV